MLLADDANTWCAWQRMHNTYTCRKACANTAMVCVVKPMLCKWWDVGVTWHNRMLERVTQSVQRRYLRATVLLESQHSSWWLIICVQSTATCLALQTCSKQVGGWVGSNATHRRTTTCSKEPVPLHHTHSLCWLSWCRQPEWTPSLALSPSLPRSLS